jgi:hypothetical protein
MANQPLFNLQESSILKNIEADIDRVTSRLIEDIASKQRLLPVLYNYQ